MDKMIDRFGDMITEREKIKLAENLNYAMGLQFLEKQKKSNKINAIDKKIWRDMFEDIDVSPREGEILEWIKKQLGKIKVAEKRRSFI